jgi:hypothetical protein
VAKPSDEKKPDEHVHRDAPAALMLLPGHDVHDEAPADAEKVLALHAAARPGPIHKHKPGCNQVTLTHAGTHTHRCRCHPCSGCPRRTSSRQRTPTK